MSLIQFLRLPTLLKCSGQFLTGRFLMIQLGRCLRWLLRPGRFRSGRFLKKWIPGLGRWEIG